MKNPMIPTWMGSAIAQRGAPHRQAGLTLVEIMIALTIGLIVLVAVGTVFLSSRQTYRVQEDNARLQESGRYALEVIGRSFRQAGADAEMSFNPVAITVECAPPACTPVDNNGVAGATDTMRNQFYAGRDELNAGAWFTRSCIGGLVAAGTVVTNIFDMAADGASTATGTGLRCSDGVGAAQILVSNVEDLQVIYGIDINADQSADQYVVAPTAAQWPQVVSARVCVLVQSEGDGLTSTAQTYLNCEGALGNPTGGATTTVAGDRRLHRSFVATYNLRNRISAAP